MADLRNRSSITGGRYNNITTKNGRYNNTTPTTTAGLTAQLTAAIEALKPGGEMYSKLSDELGRDAQLYGNQLSAGAVSKGLGNAALGDSAKVFKQLQSAKTQLQSNMMNKYIGSLTNLVQLVMQQEQAANQAASQTASGNMASQGFSQAGTKLTDFGFGDDPMASSFTSKYPSLSVATGIGGGSTASDLSKAPDLFGDINF